MDDYNLNDYTLYHEDDKKRCENEIAKIIKLCKAKAN